jgi:hypothetical protein
MSFDEGVFGEMIFDEVVWSQIFAWSSIFFIWISGKNKIK